MPRKPGRRLSPALEKGEMRIHDLGITTQYGCPTWTGNGFVEEIPQALWNRLPESLRRIAVEEIYSGNSTESILENRERNIVLLALRTGPLIDRKSDSVVKVHTWHECGNYCYDGTKATSEDIKTGCFLAFEDPDYKEQVY